MIQNETSEKRDIDPAVIDRKETWRKYHESIRNMEKVAKDSKDAGRFSFVPPL